ncbi:hypothetical protein SKAU_G00397460 [Synaphobranchus kaupii]|uniref:Uncharacterized protein n=1 Tax=Synaphobranchus kaupii TaxID=118154 RepID=A0A9Q1E8F3_SYNKA|nr:hypothetical protein SKAU_G00397460 [Synaphobranchus kaupii]
MLSRNILIFSAVVFLAPIVSTAPVEEKEPDETELEVEDGEELSEEEDDEDDSKMQDMNMGTGAQKATAAPKGAGTSSQHEASFEGGSSNGHKVNGGSPIHTGSSSSSTSATGGIEGGNGGKPHVQPSSSHGAGVHGSSMSQVHSPGAADTPTETLSHDSGTQMGSSSGIISEVYPQPSVSDNQQSTSQMDTAGVSGLGSQINAPEATGFEAPDAEFNGNGQKLLVNGALKGYAGTVHIANGAAQTDLAGSLDHSSTDPHADILGLVDLFLHDIHTAVSGSSSQIASTDLGLVPGQSSSSGSHPDAPASSPGYTVLSDTQSDSTVPADPSGFHQPSLGSTSGGDVITFGDHSHAPGDTVGAWTHNVHTSFPSDTTNEAILSDMMSHTDHSHIDYPEGAVDVSSTHSSATNGNHLVTDIHHDVTIDHHGIDSQLDSTVITSGAEAHTIIPQTDVMGAVSLHESMPHTGITVPGDILSSSVLDIGGLGEEATASGHSNTTELLLGTGLEPGSTDSVNLQGEHIEPAAPVTGGALNTMSQTDGVGMVTADPQGIHEGLSQSGITPQAQPAASAAEQHITSGQGAEGAENMELEDTC